MVLLFFPYLILIVHLNQDQTHRIHKLYKLHHHFQRSLAIYYPAIRLQDAAALWLFVRQLNR